MPFTRDETGRALLGGVALADVLARVDVPTPFYAYDVDAIVVAARDLAAGFAPHQHLVCYAVKANGAGRIVRRLAALGVGADIVSGGELSVCLAAGVAPQRIVWSGVAKTNDEIDHALAHDILSIHVESVEELARVAARAKAAGRVGRVSLRLNPGVEADTHAGIATGHDEAKFGVPISDLDAALAEIRAHASLRLVGVSSHVGSQMTTIDAYVDGARALASAARRVIDARVPIELVDLGGGMGVDYGDGCHAQPAEFARAAARVLDDARLADLTLLCEPGRALVANAGVLVARVIQTKRWSRPGSVGWVFLDAGMNDLVRPAMYGARHRVEPLVDRGGPRATWRVAGPVCESSDDFGTFELPVAAPDAVVIRDAGAYGFAMACQYNGRALATEVFIEGGAVTSVARAATVDEWAARRGAT